MNYWLASYSALLPGQDFTSRSPYIQARSSFVLSQLPLPTPFAVTDPNLVVDTDYATINGQAGIDVKEIYVEGIDEPLEPAWTTTGSGTNEVFYWHVSVPVDPGENILQFLAHDFRGNLIASDSITVTSTLIARPLRDYLRITELMYDPVPSPILGPYWRKLSNNAERVAIEKPQAPDNPGDSLSWVIVDEVIYFDQYPWPADADGQGRSLQRRAVTLCGRDPSAWSLAMPKPGVSSADFNRDGNVDSKDLAIFGQAWLTLIDGQYWNPDCDISYPPNDSIDVFDFSILGQEWLDGS